MEENSFNSDRFESKGYMFPMPEYLRPRCDMENVVLVKVQEADGRERFHIRGTVDSIRDLVEYIKLRFPGEFDEW